jgi:hypothetical protein
VVKSVQYGVRHHSTCAVETMPVALERHGEIHHLIGKAGPQRRVWSATIAVRQQVKLRRRCSVWDLSACAPARQ